MKRWVCHRCGQSFEPREPAHSKPLDERLVCECGVAYTVTCDEAHKCTCWLIRRGELPPGNIRKIA